MICKLCLQDKELRNSHIIPEFFYKPCYFVIKNNRRILDIRENNYKNLGYINKGYREKILCQECEDLLNREYETYFSWFWYKKIIPETPKEIQNGSPCFYIPDINYSKFKLCLLSILWRASVSTLENFSQVRLGPHEDKLRNMLLNKDAKLECDYQIFAFLLKFKDKDGIFNGIISPTFFRMESRIVYNFVFGGCAWYFIISKPPIKYPVSQLQLSEKGTIGLPIIDFKDFKPAYNLLLSHFKKKGYGK